MNILRTLGKSVENSIAKQYLKIAHDLELREKTFRDLRIVGSPASVQLTVEALTLIERDAAEGEIELVNDNLSSVYCIDGAVTKTLPAAQVYIANATELVNVGVRRLAVALLQAAAYIDFYRDRVVFLPSWFQRQTDRQARIHAHNAAVRLFAPLD